MKVKIQTGKSHRPTCIVDVEVTTFRGSPCIEIDSPFDIHPEEKDRPDILDESYNEIGRSIFEDKVFELDERDSRTMWIWKSTLKNASNSK